VRIEGRGRDGTQSGRAVEIHGSEGQDQMPAEFQPLVFPHPKLPHALRQQGLRQAEAMMEPV